MHTENTPYISAVRAGFLTEASGHASVPEGQVSWLNPLLHMHSGDRLLRSSDQVHSTAVIIITAFNLVQVLAEVGELARLLHDGFLHKVRWLNVRVATLMQLAQTVVDKRLVEHDTKALKIVATMASDTGASLHLEDSKTLHDLVMAQLSQLGAIGYNRALFSPCAHHDIIVLILRDGYRAMNDISDLSKQSICLGLNLLVLCL